MRVPVLGQAVLHCKQPEAHGVIDVGQNDIAAIPGSSTCAGDSIKAHRGERDKTVPVPATLSKGGRSALPQAAFVVSHEMCVFSKAEKGDKPRPVVCQAECFGFYDGALGVNEERSGSSGGCPQTTHTCDYEGCWEGTLLQRKGDITEM